MGAWDMMKDAIGLAKTIGNRELHEKLLEIGDKAMEQQSEIADLREENRNLKAAAALRAQVHVFHGLYWQRLADGKLDGPFSPRPWDLEQKLARMVYSDSRIVDGRPIHHFVCRLSEIGSDVPTAFYQKQAVLNSEELPADSEIRR